MPDGRKTKRIFEAADFSGSDFSDAIGSVNNALALLRDRGLREGREVLYDTLEVTIERDVVDASTLEQPAIENIVTIVVSAEAVRR